MLFLGVVVVTTSCDEPFSPSQGSRTYHLPMGWKLYNGTQMLARSYPYVQWISLISRLKGKNQHLFTAPFIAPAKPGGKFFGFGQSAPQRMPGQRPKKKNVPKTYGFTFWFRCNRDVSLELRLPIRTQNLERAVYRYPFKLPKTGAKWKSVRFLYNDFRPVNPKTAKAQMDPLLVSRVEFWERKAKKHPFSVSLTIKGPIAYRSKKPPKATSRPTSRPTSRTTSKPSSQPNTQPTSRPAQQPKK